MSAETATQLLERYLAAKTEAEAEQRLGILTESVIFPTCRSVLRRQLPQEEENLLSTVALAVTQRLRRWYGQVGEPPLRDLEGYVAVVTRNTIDTHLRRSNPDWMRLRSRIRYRFEHDTRLALWEEGGSLVCGKAGWQGARALGTLPERTEAQDSELALPELCLTLLERTGGGVPLDALATCVAAIYGVQTHEPLTGDVFLELAAAPESLEDALVRRNYLEALWVEVQLLPERQATALLLNLRDANGRGVLELLLSLELAEPKQVATALGWTEAELTRLWERLPIDDNEIAGLLGVTRQQVINLRKVARERLERRMRGLEVGKV